MNFNFYIFGNPSGKFTQYPDDYLSSLIETFQSGLTGSRLVIKRELNLFHYVFYDRIDANHFIGLCILFNNSQVTKPKELITLFKQVIENDIVSRGVFLAYNNQGELYFPITGFSENIKEVNRIKDTLENSFISNPVRFGIKETSRLYDGTKTSSTISINAPDAQILSLTEKYNTVYIESEDSVSTSHIEKVMAEMRADRERSLTRIRALESDVSKLSRQKKQYGWIAFLSVIVLAALVGLYFLNSNLTGVITNKDAEIKRLYKTTELQEATITVIRDSVGALTQLLAEKDKKINDTEEALSEANKEIHSVRKELESIEPELSRLTSAKQRLESSLSSFRKVYPLAITKLEIGNIDNNGEVETDYGATIYSGRTMFLAPRITYTGINSDKTISLHVRFYTPNGLSSGSNSPNGFSYSSSLYVSSGSGNTATLKGWGGNTKGHWKSGSYRFEIWYEDVCLKAKSFTVY